MLARHLNLRFRDYCKHVLRFAQFALGTERMESRNYRSTQSLYVSLLLWLLLLSYYFKFSLEKDTAMKVFSGSLSKSIYTVLILSPLEYQSPPVQMCAAAQGFKGALKKLSKPRTQFFCPSPTASSPNLTLNK